MARAGERTLSLEDVEPAALQAAERARFERIGKVGRYGFELFEAVVLAREAWLDNVLVEREVAAGVELPQPARKALEHGVESLTGAEYNARESYLGGLREKYRCELDVPAFRQAVGRPGAARRGRSDASVTITEFIDLRCPACARMTEVTRAVADEFGDAVAIEDRLFALAPRGGDSYRLAEAAMCAGEQDKYWEFRDRALAHTGDSRPADVLQMAIAADLGLDLSRLEGCLETGQMADVVRRDQEEGAALGVFGTPTIFVNGRRYMGGGAEQIRRIVELELYPERRREGCPRAAGG